MQSVLRVKAERPLLLDPGEACQMITALQATAHLPGEIAEIGVAFGASAKLILEYAAGRKVHLFDTFQGLPRPSSSDSAKFSQGDFYASIESVCAYLAGFPVEYHVGRFPETAGEIGNDVRFSFVHMDVDLFESTIECLRVFYPLMTRGGIMLSHDFCSAAGVSRAFEEFFRDKPEPVIEEVSGYQALVVKL